MTKGAIPMLTLISKVAGWIMPNLKTFLILVGALAALLLGSYVQGCNEGQRREASKNATVIAQLRAEIEKLQTLTVETKEESKPIPITFKPAKGSVKAKSEPKDGDHEARLKRLQEQYAELYLDLSKADRDLNAALRLNEELSRPFSADTAGVMTANDSIKIPYRLTMVAKPLNHLEGSEAFAYILSLADTEWFEKTITEIQRIPIPAPWWQWPAVVAAWLAALVLGSLL